MSSQHQNHKLAQTSPSRLLALGQKERYFVPDIVYVDYLGVFLSIRSFKGSGMYENGKFVSEDLRAFAQKHKLPVVTAIQLNRGGYSSSDPDLDDSAESFSVTHPADLIIMVTRKPHIRM